MGRQGDGQPRNYSLWILIILIVIAIIIIVVIWFCCSTRKNNLPAPTGLSTTVNESTVTLNWNLVTGADKYRVYITKNSNCSDWASAEFKQDVNGPPAEVSNLENGTYFFSVAAVKFCNGFETVGCASSPVSTTVPQCNGSPSAPADIIVNPGHNVGYVQVTWTAIPGAADYIIYRSENAPVSTSSYTQRYQIEGCKTSVTFVGISCGTTQNFIVTAANACGTEGGASPVGTIVVPSQEFWGNQDSDNENDNVGKTAGNSVGKKPNNDVAGSFVDITDVVPNGNSISISWAPFKNADEYNVYIKEGGSVDSGEGEHDTTQVLSNTITAFTFRNLVPGRTYSVGISITKDGNEGGVAYFPVQLVPLNAEQQHLENIEGH